MSECGSSKKPKLDPNLRDVLEELECPVCREYMAPPISMCVSGHSICDTCRQKLKKCQMCTKRFKKSRNLVLEKIIGKMKYPCKYEDLGCTSLFNLERLASHQADCPRQTRRCPFAVLDSRMCTWEGAEDAVVSHIRTDHSDNCTTFDRAGRYRTRLWYIVKGPLWCRAVFTQDDVFLWCTKFVQNRLYSCLVYLRVKEQGPAFMYRMSISKLGRTGCTLNSGRTSPFPKTTDNIFQSCDCIIFRPENVKKCLNAKKCLLAEIKIYRPVQHPS